MPGARSFRSRRRAATDLRDVTPPAVGVCWDDLTDDEKTALKRMNRGPYFSLTREVGTRLIDLGLAVARPGGIGISRQGRELVINTLLEAGRREDSLR